MATPSSNDATDQTALSGLAPMADAEKANGTQHHEILSHITLANLINNINLAQQNAVANQQALNELGVAVLGKVVNLITNIGPLEAMAVTKLDTGNEFAEQLADLKATLASFGGTAPAPEPSK